MFFDPPAGRFPRVLLLLPLAFSFGCRKEISEAPPRYAVLRFENLSGDPGLEWAARAASEYLSRSLSGALSGPVLHVSALSRLSLVLGSRPGNAPGISTERSEALVAGATRLIAGYVERSAGAIRIEGDEIDVRSGRSIRRVSASGGDVMSTLSRLSHAFSPSAQPYLTNSAEALKLYVAGFEGPADQALPNLERSVQADPDFGPAWALWVDASLARGNREAVKSLLEQAEHRHLDQLARANLQFSSALLRNDQADRLVAMRQIAALSPGDTVMLRSTAEADTRAGEFEHAADEWNKLAAVLPDDPSAWNQLGYTRAWGGDYRGALAAMKEYQRLRPSDPNPLDSQGDVHFLFGKYSDAAARYRQANALNPDFLNGGELYKMARAKFNAGDKTGADAAFAQFRAYREKTKTTALWLTEADWLYRTGRQKEGVAVLLRQSSPEAKVQLAIWDLAAGDRAGAAKLMSEAGTPGNAPALIARFASLPTASAAEWERRAERLLPAPLRPIALGYALVLDAKTDDARPVWARVAETAPGTDFFSHAIYARLNGEDEKLAILPDPDNVNEFAAVLDTL